MGARHHTRIMTMIQKGLNDHNKDNGSYEIDTRLSSRPESPHVDSPFILLGRRLSSPCISILRMPGSILKTVRVHHEHTTILNLFFHRTFLPLALSKYNLRTEAGSQAVRQGDRNTHAHTNVVIF